jgi:hypothetical protein
VLPKTRQEAIDTGAKFYFTGKACVHGHIAPRLRKGTCTECRKLDWQKQNDVRKSKPKSAAAKRAGKKYYENNKELVKARALARPTEAKREYRRKYDKEHPEQRKLRTNLRRKRFKQATPPWLSAEDRSKIRQIYMQAQQMTELTGERYTVDHIVPLNGKLVCGLHVPWNLEIVTHRANCKKHNKHAP